MNLDTNDKWFYGIAIALWLIISLAYSNHFDNEFHFDDTHTIVANEYIRDISNLPKFFTSDEFYGTMPTNRGYNPILVSLNAIDYWLAGELNVKYFHTSIFLSYLFLLFLLFLFLRNLYEFAEPGRLYNVKLFSLLAVGFFGLHAANAETINYVIMRSDSFSTLCVIASFLLYQHPMGRRYYLYLITMLIAIGTKETGVMFGPMLFMYIYIMEMEGDISKLKLKEEWDKVIAAFIKSLPAIALGFITFYLIRTQFVAADKMVFGGGNSFGVYKYFITQWVVISHYLGNFILPLDLSADPDFKLYTSIFNRKVLFGLALLLSLVGFGVYCTTKKSMRPIAFGIAWFFLALAPTSSFHPLGQVSNDHRTFFPYIGLIILLFWICYLIYKKYAARILATPNLKNALLFGIVAVYGLHAYGTYQRNEVWDNEESLWYDVTIKSPNNGRGLMNYALNLMSRGEYEETLKYFERAMTLMPRYSYLHINMGILKNAMGLPVEAERYYQNALRFDPYNAEAYYYYAAFLNNQNRKDEAIAQLEQANKISPGHVRVRNFLQKLKQPDVAREREMKDLMNKIIKDPKPVDYLNLSLAQYRMGNYADCIASCQEAIKMKPDYAAAYNNMCSAYNKLKQPDKAIEACQKALEIDPEFNLAKNNLRWALEIKQKQSGQ